MDLIRVELETFRGFKAASFDLAAPGLTFLVGSNNAGKSALLLAIDRLVRPTAEASDAHAGTTRSAILATFELDLGEREKLVRVFSPDPKWLKGDAAQRVAWRFEQSANNNEYFETEVRLSVADGTLYPYIQETNPWPNGQFRRADLSEWFSRAAPDQPFDRRLDGAVGGGHLGGLGEQPMPSLVRLLSEWRSRTYHLTPLRPGTDANRSINLTPVLEPTGRNLAEVLAWVRLNAGAEFEQIAATMRELVPGVGELMVPGQGSQVRIAFRDDQSYERNVTDLGTGVQQLLMAVFLGTHHPSGGLISLEEPESNLHPDAQRWLLRRFEEWTTNRQIVASTHSTVFLDRAAESGARIWLVERRDGVSTVSATTPTGAGVLDALGVRLSDVLNASLIILVEGDSDRLVMEQWYAATLQAARARVVASGGGDSAWDVDRWQHWIDAASALPQRALFIRDRDELGDTKIRKLQRQSGVFVLHRRELENYLLDPAAIRQVMDARCDAAGVSRPGWTDAEVADLLVAASDDLQSGVICKRVVDRLGNLTLVPRRDLEALVAAGPSARALAHLVRGRTGVGREVHRLWRDETRAVKAAWPTSRLELAPGSELLQRLFEEAGLRYEKVRDAPLLAALVAPPKELTSRIRTALRQVGDS